MLTDSIRNRPPSEAAVFHLVPKNAAARAVLNHESNTRLVSGSENGREGLEIGFHGHQNPNPTTIITIGSRGDVVATGCTITCTFEYLPASNAIWVQEILSLRDEPQLQVWVDMPDSEGTSSDPVPPTATRVLTYGQDYTLLFGSNGPEFSVVWACTTLGRTIHDLSSVSETQFCQRLSMLHLDPRQVIAKAHEQNSRLVRQIVRGQLPSIQDAQDGKGHRKIGQGGFGAVYSTLDVLYGIPVAMKVFRLSDFASNQAKKRELTLSYTREVEALQRIKHVTSSTHHDVFLFTNYQQPNIIEFLGMSTSDDLRIFMPLRDGNLTAHMSGVRNLQRVELCQNFSLQILEALNYLHSCSMIHRDLKPENILVQKTGLLRDDPHTRFQLADFGLANSLDQARTRCGTLIYAAPELFAMEAEQTTKIDIYSLFVCMVEVLEPLIRVQWQPPSTHMVNGALSLAKQRVMLRPFASMIEFEPSERPSAETLLQEKDQLWSLAKRAAERFGYTTNIPRVPASPAFLQRRPMTTQPRRLLVITSPRLNAPDLVRRPGPERRAAREGGQPFARMPGNERGANVDRARLVERFGTTPRRGISSPSQPSAGDAGEQAHGAHGNSPGRDPRGVMQRERPARDNYRVTKRSPRAEPRIIIDTRTIDSILALAIPGGWPTSQRE